MWCLYTQLLHQQFNNKLVKLIMQIETRIILYVHSKRTLGNDFIHIRHGLKMGTYLALWCSYIKVKAPEGKPEGGVKEQR